MGRLRTAVVLVLLATVASGCGDEKPKAPGAVFVDKLGHVHAVGIDPADGATLIAAHNGLFRAPAGQRQPSLVGDQNRDVMGFVVEGAQQYAGSGHPDVRSNEPSSVGFIRTTDGGRNWKNVSLAGRADLHAIEVAGKVVYAFDALSGKLLSSADAGRTWKRATVPPVLDLAIDPQNSRRVVASTEQGLIVSRDGGRSFEPLAEFPLSVLAWTGEGAHRDRAGPGRPPHRPIPGQRAAGRARTGDSRRAGGQRPDHGCRGGRRQRPRELRRR
ncbi:exo-alpha-sialidase [Conexibacter sp. W3-3-2]|uniref:WD40/YVTN/BNR-like repeat-containing protein n=1 Tax=Conexibacter sp. W3-3-2 TaxID=2675227 RepID=UPI0012B70EFA|nr:exo-alpha-sialidase [Conexibacter sp. W3-3-2]MTD47542.1 exo-alpha-sialidase [Conexibacter sp. W3-3-2]